MGPGDVESGELSWDDDYDPADAELGPHPKDPTYQASKLDEHLEAAGYNVESVDDPGGCALRAVIKFSENEITLPIGDVLKMAGMKLHKQDFLTDDGMKVAVYVRKWRCNYCHNTGFAISLDKKKCEQCPIDPEIVLKIAKHTIGVISAKVVGKVKPNLVEIMTESFGPKSGVDWNFGQHLTANYQKSGYVCKAVAEGSLNDTPSSVKGYYEVSKMPSYWKNVKSAEQLHDEAEEAFKSAMPGKSVLDVVEESYETALMGQFANAAPDEAAKKGGFEDLSKAVSAVDLVGHQHEWATYNDGHIRCKKCGDLKDLSESAIGIDPAAPKGDETVSIGLDENGNALVFMTTAAPEEKQIVDLDFLKQEIFGAMQVPVESIQIGLAKSGDTTVLAALPMSTIVGSACNGIISAARVGGLVNASANTEGGEIHASCTYDKDGFLVLRRVLNNDKSRSYILSHDRNGETVGVLGLKQVAAPLVMEIDETFNPGPADFILEAKPGNEVLRITKDGEIIVNTDYKLFLGATGMNKAFAAMFWKALESENPLRLKLKGALQKVEALEALLQIYEKERSEKQAAEARAIVIGKKVVNRFRRILL